MFPKILNTVHYRDLFNQPRTRNVLPDPESKETKLIILRTDLEKIGTRRNPPLKKKKLL